MQRKQSIANARSLLRSSELGVLSTHSKSNPGFPFGSVSTYMSTVHGEVIFYISDLAQHTKNILANPRMCLTVYSGAEGQQASEEDPNAGARLSLLGEAEALNADMLATVSERFFSLYPQSRRYQNTHDFAFYILRCQRVRFIGGFGDIHWISREEWMLDTPEWLPSEHSMIEHMNDDHMDAMQLICRQQFGINAEKVRMLGVHPDGCFVRADNSKPLFVPFDVIASSGREVRQQLVALTQAARAALSPAAESLVV